MHRDFVPKSLIQAAAFFWGIACFLPVGMSYLAAVLLFAFLLWRLVRVRAEATLRWQQIRRHAAFWPLCFLSVWMVFIWCVLPHYKETPSNLFHGFRIVLTILLVLLLRKSELIAALLGAVLGATLALVIIYANLWIPLPMVPGLRNLLDMSQGNKSIGIAVTLAIFAVCSFLYAIRHCQDAKAAVAYVPLLLVIPVLIWFLPSRTSLLLVAICLGMGLIHHFWKRPLLLSSAIIGLVLSGLTVAQISELNNRFAIGATQLRTSASAAHDAQVNPSEASWAIRHTMYTQTAKMVLEKPMLGWGIGAWNEQWRARTPAKIHGFNMPHNDFLWMGAQTGVFGALALLAIMLSLLLNVLRLCSFAASCSIMATSGLLIAMSFNSALRDAQIGMSVLFLVVALNAWALANNNNNDELASVG